MTPTKQPRCVFVVEQKGSKNVKVCGEEVPVYDLPQDSTWPVLCSTHLRTYTSPGGPPAPPTRLLGS